MSRAIVFDLDGTLLSFDRPYGTVLSETFERSVGESRQEWVDTYSESFFERFRALDPEPVRRAFAAVGVGDPGELRGTLLEREIAASEPPSGAHDDLERLAAEYRLGVLTNGLPDWQLAKLRAHDVEGRFDAVVTSYEVGAHKPDPAPFREVERRIEGEGYAMVGDSDGDIEGARGVGWSALRYDGGGFGGVPGKLGYG
ncbi:HAD family hydrolase [Natronorarus salvus]|uniref:HAD family hydrolase n=1 Tax=Natronorarus salvus TaxID=3117733 RepID=UPI002F265086